MSKALTINATVEQSRRVASFWRQNGEQGGAMIVQPKVNAEGRWIWRIGIFSPEEAQKISKTLDAIHAKREKDGKI